MSRAGKILNILSGTYADYGNIFDAVVNAYPGIIEDLEGETEKLEKNFAAFNAGGRTEECSFDGCPGIACLVDDIIMGLYSVESPEDFVEFYLRDIYSLPESCDTDAAIGKALSETRIYDAGFDASLINEGPLKGCVLVEHQD